MADHLYQRYSHYLIGESPPSAGNEPRSPVAKDRDRIVHCGAFRRLQRKSQIVGVQSFDFFRTRLTHTLECAQIGRGIAKRISDAGKLDLSGLVAAPQDFPDLVEAACLAHDLGHPPFGHNGEKALSKMVKEHGDGLFEGNAQSLRIVTRLEPKRLVKGQRCGLDLTATTLRAILKYRETEKEAKSAGKTKFCFYDDPDEQEVRAWLLDGEGAQETLAMRVLDLADDIAYACHDFEDGVWSRMIPISRLLADDDSERNLVWNYVTKDSPGLFNDTTVEQQLEGLFGPFRGESWARVPFDRSFGAKAGLKNFSAELIGKLIEDAVGDGSFPASKDALPRETRQQIALLKALATVYMITSPALETMRYGQRQLIERLFSAYWDNPEMLPQREEWRALEEANPGRLKEPIWREKCVLVRDHLAGMTDLFALHTHGEMFGTSAAPSLRKL